MATLLEQLRRSSQAVQGQPTTRLQRLRSGIPFFENTPTTESLENIQRYNERLVNVGVEPPKRKMVMGTVNKVLDVLRTGEYAVGGILAGEGPITGIKEKISPSEVFGVTPNEETSFLGLLKQPKFYGALALDIVFDPVTYLTFGFGAGAKITAGATTKVLNKLGTDLLKRASTQFGEDSARKMLATSIMREGGEKYLKTGGLKFMGKEFLPRKVVQAPFRGVDWVIEKTPFVGWGYLKTKDILAKAFKPFAAIEELPAQFGGDGRFEEIILKTQKGIRGQTKREMDYISGLAKEASKAGVKNPGEVITNMIEFDVRTGNKALDDMANYMQETLKGFGFAEQKVGILGKSVPVHIPGYMRHFLTDEGREFLVTKGKKIQDEFANNVKNFRVKAPFAKERKIKDAVMNINNLYKEKYGIKLFEPDAFKAFSQRTAEHIKATQMYNMFQNVVDERIAIRAPIVPELKRTKGGLAISRRATEETIVDGIKMIKTKIPQMEGFLVAEPIAKHLDMVHGMMTKEEVSKSILGIYDKVLSFWKGSVTGWFPAFHSRNMIGGMFNNWLAGVWNPKWYKSAEDVIRGKDVTFTTSLGQKITSKQLLREVEDLGVTGAPGMIDMMRDVEEMVKIGNKSGIKQISQYPRAAMEAVEDRLRIPLYIFRRIEKGDTASQAAKEVFKFHFDYAPEAFSQFERNVMRRIIPFYTWTKNNVPLQIQELMKQPGKFAALEKMRRTIETAASATASEDNELLPEWMKEMFVFRLPGESKDGFPRYLQLDLPLEDINKLPFTESGRREIISLLSPFLKYPVERIANRNLYFGSDVYNADLPREYQTAKAIEGLRFLPDPIKEYLNFNEVQKKNAATGQMETRYEMDSIKLHAIRSILAGRFYSTIGSATDSELDVWMKLSRILGGVPVRAVDFEEEQYNRTKEQEILSREVVNYLRRRGIVPTSEGLRQSGETRLQQLKRMQGL